MFRKVESLPPVSYTHLRQLFKRYMPLLIMLFFANLFITILRDIKEDFLVNIIDIRCV